MKRQINMQHSTVAKKQRTEVAPQPHISLHVESDADLLLGLARASMPPPQENCSLTDIESAAVLLLGLARAPMLQPRENGSLTDIESAAVLLLGLARASMLQPQESRSLIGEQRAAQMQNKIDGQNKQLDQKEQLLVQRELRLIEMQKRIIRQQRDLICRKNQLLLKASVLAQLPGQSAARLGTSSGILPPQTMPKNSDTRAARPPALMGSQTAQLNSATAAPSLLRLENNPLTQPFHSPPLQQQRIEPLTDEQRAAQTQNTRDEQNEQRTSLGGIYAADLLLGLARAPTFQPQGAKFPTGTQRIAQSKNKIDEQNKQLDQREQLLVQRELGLSEMQEKVNERQEELQREERELVYMENQFYQQLRRQPEPSVARSRTSSGILPPQTISKSNDTRAARTFVLMRSQTAQPNSTTVAPAPLRLENSPLAQPSHCSPTGGILLQSPTIEPSESGTTVYRKYLKYSLLNELLLALRKEPLQRTSTQDKEYDKFVVCLEHALGKFRDFNINARNCKYASQAIENAKTVLQKERLVTWAFISILRYKCEPQREAWVAQFIDRFIKILSLSEKSYNTFSSFSPFCVSSINPRWFSQELKPLVNLVEYNPAITAQSYEQLNPTELENQRNNYKAIFDSKSGETFLECFKRVYFSKPTLGPETTASTQARNSFPPQLFTSSGLVSTAEYSFFSHSVDRNTAATPPIAGNIEMPRPGSR